MYRFLIIFTLSLSIFFPSLAQVRKYSNDFLNLAGNASYQAAGNTRISGLSASDIVFNNPAASGNRKENGSADFTHGLIFGSQMVYDCAAVQYMPDSTYALSLGLLRVGVDDIQNTLDFLDPAGNPDYSRISKFSVADYALGISYSQQWNAHWRLGATAKLIYRHIGDFATAAGLGFDAAATYTHKQHQISFVATDILGSYTAWIYNTEMFDSTFILTGNTVPQNTIEIKTPSFRVHYQTHFALNADFNLSPSVALILFPAQQYNTLLNSKYVSVGFAIGTELTFRQLLCIRAGASRWQWAEQWDGSRKLNFSPTAGIGVKPGRFSVDYTFGNFTSYSLGNNHLVSLSFLF